MKAENIYCGYTDEDNLPTNPLPHQEEYHLFTGHIKHHLLAGSLGTGKTEAMCVEAVKQCAEIPDNLGLMGRKVLDAFKKSTLLSLLDIGRGFIRRHYAVDRRIEFKNGSTIVYMALDDSRDAIQRIKSMNLGFFAFDQLEEVPEDTFIAANGQLRRKNASRCSFHTCNPAGHNWVWKKWKYGNDENYRLIETRTWTEGIDAPATQQEVRAFSDNPYLPYDYIRSLLEMPEQWVKRYVYCGWDNFSGLVYPMFDDKVHMVKSWGIPSWYNHYIVYDYGYKNPSAFLFAAVDAEGFVWVYDIIYEAEQTIEELAYLMKAKLREGITYTFLADPSIGRTERDGNTISGEWEDYGIYWEKARNDKRAGYDRVARYLTPDEKGVPKMTFFDIPCMQHLKDEIVSYRWKELKYSRGDKAFPEEAVKVNDHLMDNLRYLVHYVEDSTTPVDKQDWGLDWSSLYQGKTDNSGWMGL